MNTYMVVSPPPSADVDELIAKARALVPELRERAMATEIAGRVSDEVTDALRSAGLLKIMKPQCFGGFAMPPSAVARIGYELGRGCGSTSWCTMVANTTSWYATYWPSAIQARIWAENPDNLVCGAVAPTGLCEKVDGGYALSGKWPFASNCDNSHWMIISAMLPAEGDQPGGVGWFMTPRDTLKVDHQSWQVCGLGGTGSKTCYAEEPIFVADDALVRFSDVLAGTTPGHDIEGNITARFGFTTFGASCLAASLLGMSRGALDWFIEAMKNKVRVPLRAGAPASAAQNPYTQSRIGEASAAIDAAMELLIHDLALAEEKVLQGEPLTVHERVTLRRNAGLVARQAVVAVNLLFEGAGASSSDLSVPIQRFWRDVNCGARHVTLDVQAINTLVGQEQLGLPLTGQF